MALGRFLRRPDSAPRPVMDDALLLRALDLAALSARQHMECGVPPRMRAFLVRSAKN